MASGAVPVERIAENELSFAIRDINPRAPTHMLIVSRAHIASAREIDWSHTEILGAMFMLASEVARLEGVSEGGYRLAFNVGDAAGMTIDHLHLHLLGGRRLGAEG